MYSLTNLKYFIFFLFVCWFVCCFLYRGLNMVWFEFCENQTNNLKSKTFYFILLGVTKVKSNHLESRSNRGKMFLYSLWLNGNKAQTWVHLWTICGIIVELRKWPWLMIRPSSICVPDFTAFYHMIWWVAIEQKTMTANEYNRFLCIFSAWPLKYFRAAPL